MHLIQLTRVSDRKKIHYNLDRALQIERVAAPGTSEATQIIFAEGIKVYVAETPEQIAKLSK